MKKRARKKARQAFVDLWNVADPVGYELMANDNGQRFTLIAVEPYERKDGTPSCVAVWESKCHTCGCIYLTRSSLAPTHFFSRRCKAHKRQGSRVRFEARQP
jgi:hypothetical protein